MTYEPLTAKEMAYLRERAEREIGWAKEDIAKFKGLTIGDTIARLGTEEQQRARWAAVWFKLPTIQLRALAEIEESRAKLAHARRILERIEWAATDVDGNDYVCPYCAELKITGAHDATCGLAAALTDLGEP